LRRRLHGRSWRGCRELSAAGQALAWILLARYPVAFQAEPTAMRPLKIGIDRDIQQALHADPTVLRAVLRGYTLPGAPDSLAVNGLIGINSNAS
jgi:RNA chaperone ProQ/FINO-like protein